MKPVRAPVVLIEETEHTGPAYGVIVSCPHSVCNARSLRGYPVLDLAIMVCGNCKRAIPVRVDWTNAYVTQDMNEAARAVALWDGIP